MEGPPEPYWGRPRKPPRSRSPPRKPPRSRSPPRKRSRGPRNSPRDSWLRISGCCSGFTSGQVAIQHALLLEQGARRLRRLRAATQPLRHLVLVDLDRSRLGQRVVVPELLDEPAITRRPRIRHHEAVKGPPLGAHPPQPDLDQSSGTSCCGGRAA